MFWPEGNRKICLLIIERFSVGYYLIIPRAKVYIGPNSWQFFDKIQRTYDGCLSLRHHGCGND